MKSFLLTAVLTAGLIWYWCAVAGQQIEHYLTRIGV